MKHHCHVNKCQTTCAPSMLMCSKHWAMVPVSLRMPVVSNYRSGQCADRRPSKEWLKAARAALNHVAKLEGNFHGT